MAKKDKASNRLRLELASDLRKIADILSIVCNDNSIQVNLYTVVSKLRNSTSNDTWEYEVNDLRLPIKKKRHLRPQAISNLHLFVSAHIKADYKKWNSSNDGDPFIDMNFNVRIIGEVPASSDIYEFGFHIDRMSDQDEPEEMHPLYHIHYFNNSTIGDSATKAICMDSPRLIHHPVEFIIGVDMTLANFNKDIYDKLVENGQYMNIYKKYSESILKPYFANIANQLSTAPCPEIKNNSMICPYIK